MNKAILKTMGPFARYLLTGEKPDAKDVHTEHCCLIHGCKYNNDDCPVVEGRKKQSFPCESCEWDNSWRQFSWLKVGDMFAAEAARFVKMGEFDAICVMTSNDKYRLNQYYQFKPNYGALDGPGMMTVLYTDNNKDEWGY